MRNCRQQGGILNSGYSYWEYSSPDTCTSSLGCTEEKAPPDEEEEESEEQGLGELLTSFLEEIAGSGVPRRPASPAELGELRRFFPAAPVFAFSPWLTPSKSANRTLMVGQSPPARQPVLRPGNDDNGPLAPAKALWHCAPASQRRRSSGVERAIGNGEAESSILSGGTTFKAEIRQF